MPPTLGVETYQWSGNTINGSLRNYSDSYVDTKNALASLNGITLGNLRGTCGQTLLNPRGSCIFSITVPNGTWVLGSPYVMKLVTSSGSFSFPMVAGGNSESAIQTQTTLITFRTVTAETTETPPAEVNTPNQGIFSQDYFAKNAFSMIGAIAGGILLIGAILGLFGISIATRSEGKGLYGEEENRGHDSRRYVPLVVALGVGAVGLLTVSILTPSLTFKLELLASRILYLIAGTLVLILIGSILGLVGVVRAVLRGRRKNLRNVEGNDAEMETVLQETRQPDEIPNPPKKVQTKRCRYCGAEIPRDDRICGKCGIPGLYLGADSR